MHGKRRMADLGHLVAALAALVVPLAFAYLLAGGSDLSRLLRRPKKGNTKKTDSTQPTIQE
jgi:hypothetical protein